MFSLALLGIIKDYCKFPPGAWSGRGSEESKHPSQLVPTVSSQMCRRAMFFGPQGEDQWGCWRQRLLVSPPLTFNETALERLFPLSLAELQGIFHNEKTPSMRTSGAFELHFLLMTSPQMIFSALPTPLRPRRVCLAVQLSHPLAGLLGVADLTWPSRAQLWIATPSSHQATDLIWSQVPPSQLQALWLCLLRPKYLLGSFLFLVSQIQSLHCSIGSTFQT